MRMRVALAALTLGALLPAGTQAAPRHAITQPAGTAGCLASAGAGCGPVAALRGVRDVAISADGRTAYAVADVSGALVVFSRRPRTGALREAACLAVVPTGNCRRTVALRGASAVALAGSDVYVAARSGGTVLQFRHGPDGRSLGYVGCVGSGAASGCAAVQPLLAGVDGLRTTGDGRVLIAQGDAGLVSLARDPVTGSLRPAGCLTVRGTPGCPGGDTLPEAPIGPVAVGARGRYLFAGGEQQLTAIRLDSFGGGLSVASCASEQLLPGCARIPGLGTAAPGGVAGGITAVALDPEGRRVSTAGFDGRLPVDPIAILTHAVRRADGELGRSTCLAVSVNEERRPSNRTCALGRPPTNGPSGLFVSPDGRWMVTLDSAYDLVALLVRNPRSGGLRRVPGRGGCIGGADAAFGDGRLPYPHSSCTVRRRLSGISAIAWAPDSRSVLVASTNAVAVLRVR